MVILPGNTIHAGEFCFGSKMEYPTAPKKVIFQNHRLHFFFCCSEQGKRNANNEKNTIISDNIHICLDDFKPEDSIMQRLFKNLLDCHISFVDIPGTKKRSGNTSKVRKKIVRKRPAKKRPAKKQIHSKKKIPKK